MLISMPGGTKSQTTRVTAGARGAARARSRCPLRTCDKGEGQDFMNTGYAE